MNGYMTQAVQSTDISLARRVKAGGTRFLQLLALLAVSSLVGVQAAETTNRLQSVDFASLAGGKAQITLTMSQPADKPLSFTIDNPARIALDFPQTSNGLSQRSQNIGIGTRNRMPG